jgi:hypothetical protein
MTKAKRKGGKGFGQTSKPDGLGRTFDFDGLAKGNLILMTGIIVDNSAGVGDIFTLLNHSDLVGGLASFKTVINLASDSSIIYMARRRQLENGAGLLTLTPRKYRLLWGLDDESDGEIIFNWWTLPELEIVQERSYIFGGSRILAHVSKCLINLPSNRFPVICHAVPFTSSSQETNCAHLIFTVPFDPEKALGYRQVHLLEKETESLTDSSL